MRVNGVKVLWIGGLVLVLSTLIFVRVADSLDTSSGQSPSAALASLYNTSDPRVLITAADTATQAASRGVVEPAVDDSRRNSIKVDFSPYVRLHATRADNLLAGDAID